MSLKAAGGQVLDHLGTKSKVGFVNGSSLMALDFEVLQDLQRPLVSVADRNDKGQMVLFGPNTQKIIKDSHAIKVIESMVNQVGGFDIKRWGDVYFLDGELKPNPDEVYKMLGVECGNAYQPSQAPPTNSLPEAFVITKECKHKRDLSNALKEVEREAEKRGC